MFRFIDVDLSILLNINFNNKIELEMHNSLIHNSPPKLSLIKELHELYGDNIKFEGYMVINENKLDNNKDFNAIIYIDGFSIKANEKLNESSIRKLSKVIKPYYFSKIC